jgi:uncharacterized membrane protein YkvA (DUF1232 family)
MPLWAWIVIGIVAAVVVTGAGMLLWIRHTGFTAAEGAAEMKSIGLDLVRLPGRLFALSRDKRVPRRARWMLIGLALYIASPIDPIPDFLPGIGYLDELVLVPFILRAIRRRIPDDLWLQYVPPRQRIGGNTLADSSGSDMPGSSG